MHTNWEIIEDPQEQRLLFKKLSRELRSKFTLHEVLKWDDQFSGYVNPTCNSYVLRVMLRGTFFGCALHGPKMADRQKFGWLINFSTYSGETGTTLVAARLARHDGSVFLLHDGNVRGVGGVNALTGVETHIDNKKFFVVAELSADKFFDNIVRFHESRLNPDLSSASEPLRSTVRRGFDPGPKNDGTRATAVFFARHHPITDSLFTELRSLDFKEIQCTIFSPDIFVSNGKVRILFEVKPDPRLHDLIVGCGQLLVYGEHFGECTRVLVSKKLNDSAISKKLRTFMENNKIVYLEFTHETGRYKFKNLSQVLDWHQQ